MTWIFVIIAFAAGLAMGCRLPGWLERLRQTRGHGNFRPVVLKLYELPPEPEEKQEGRP